ncbi:hypothetical protein RJ639_033078, partial [Escallonia herrerae]
LLQNPDFELPPSNLPGNSTAPIELLNGNNTIPWWTYEGTVQYVPLAAGGGHAIQLGQDGKINQTFIANGDSMSYLLTFALSLGGQNCSANASLVVSAPDTSSVFSWKQRYEKGTWESYGLYLGRWGDGESINLVFQSQATETDSNSICWPLVDSLLLKTIGPLTQTRGNLLLNGGFELGPDFLDNSKGTLLDPEPSVARSALQLWSVMGTVKYIDSKNYFVPQGNAAIEIVSGVSAGIQTAKTLTEGSEYSLKFMLGDANDSCMSNFVVGVQAGSVAQNFSLQSNGTGSSRGLSMAFKAESAPTLISFQSYISSQSKDGVLCGPVVDDVILWASDGPKPFVLSTFQSILLLLVVLLIDA